MIASCCDFQTDASARSQLRCHFLLSPDKSLIASFVLAFGSIAARYLGSGSESLLLRSTGAGRCRDSAIPMPGS